jgi:hypothetical protein
VIRRHRPALRADLRVHLRSNSSDWIGVDMTSEADLDWAFGLVELAVAANLPTAPPGSPPEGTDLARRRRFH